MIIQSDRSTSAAANAFQEAGSTDGGRTAHEQVKDQYDFLSSVAVTIKAKKVLALARIPGLTITSDATIELAAAPTSNQVWPTASGVRPLWSESGSQNMPTIAIVDSGIDRSHPCFSGGGRILRREVLTTLPQSSSSEDTRGHGTFVAGIAACEAAGYAGAAPHAKLVDLDVMDDNGMARTSDVIAAAEWIYRASRPVQHQGRELLAPLERCRATSRKIRSTRRSRSSGSAASRSSRQRATTAAPTARAASRSLRAMIRS